MPIEEEQLQSLISLIEDGELDDHLLEIQSAIDERNGRRREAILKLVKSVWGEDAQIVAGQIQSQTVSSANSLVPGSPEHITPQEVAAVRGQVPYTPDDGPAIPAGWPQPFESSGTGGGGAGFEPVRDPLAGGDFGDGDPDIVSTGAQIG